MTYDAPTSHLRPVGGGPLRRSDATATSSEDEKVVVISLRIHHAASVSLLIRISWIVNIDM